MNGKGDIQRGGIMFARRKLTDLCKPFPYATGKTSRGFNSHTRGCGSTYQRSHPLNHLLWSSPTYKLCNCGPHFLYICMSLFKMSFIILSRCPVISAPKLKAYLLWNRWHFLFHCFYQKVRHVIFNIRTRPFFLQYCSQKWNNLGGECSLKLLYKISRKRWRKPGNI